MSNNFKYIHDIRGNLSEVPDQSNTLGRNGWTPGDSTQKPFGRNVNAILRQNTLGNSFYKYLPVSLSGSDFFIDESFPTIGPLETVPTNHSYPAESLVFQVTDRADVVDLYMIRVIKSSSWHPGRSFSVYNSTPNQAVFIDLPTPSYFSNTEYARKILMPGQIVSFRYHPGSDILELEYDSHAIRTSMMPLDPGFQSSNRITPNGLNYYYNGNSCVASLGGRMSCSMQLISGHFPIEWELYDCYNVDRVATQAFQNRNAYGAGSDANLASYFFPEMADPVGGYNLGLMRIITAKIGNVSKNNVNDGLTRMRLPDPIRMTNVGMNPPLYVVPQVFVTLNSSGGFAVPVPSESLDHERSSVTFSPASLGCYFSTNPVFNYNLCVCGGSPIGYTVVDGGTLWNIGQGVFHINVYISYPNPVAGDFNTPGYL